MNAADDIREFKKAYLEEVCAVNELVEALEVTLKAIDAEYEIILDEGQPNERIEMIGREEFLKSMIEYAINTLSGNVGYIFPDEEKCAKK